MTPVVTTHGGLARYAEELWRALAARDDITVSAFALGRGRAPDLALPLRRFPVPLRLLRPAWRSARRPRAELFSGDVDVMHSLALLPAPTGKPSVQTIHDVLPITHPHLYPPGADVVHREEVAAAARADLVVTTCEATAEEIARVGGIPRERIVVAPPGAFTQREDGGTPPPGPYLLAVGQVTPRKGLDVLARAVARLGGRCPPVLVAGPDWWRAEDIRAKLASIGTDRRISLLGPVDDSTLARLYRGASILCHPSRAEGFGMTCLEAMEAGVPVVASDLPSIRELTGGAAVLVPVDDADALAEAIELLLGDEGERRRLAAAGRDRAAEFSWPLMAGQVVQAYRRVVA